MEATALTGSGALERLDLRFSFADCRPDPADVCRGIGYPPGETPEVALDAIQALFARGEALWSLQGGYTVYPEVGVDREHQRLSVGGAAFEAGKIVCGQFSRATSMAVFVCTAGPDIQELYQGLMTEGDPFTSLLASWLGSLTVEKAVDRLQEALRARVAARGLNITNRYSPGYCGWHVSEQHKLFALLPPGLCDVRLTDSSLMQPIKSVSGLIGIGERVRYNDYTCNVCELDDCIYRTIRQERVAKGHEAHG